MKTAQSFLGIMLFLGMTFTSFAQPKLEIEGGNIYDWGQQKPDPAGLKAKIKLFNKGTDTLKISSVKPGCGCTAAPLDKYNVEPNGFAVMDITLNASSYTGDVSKSITINSNDAAKPSEVLHLKAYMFRPLATVPSFLAFNNLIVGESGMGWIEVKNNTDKDITITKMEIFPPNLALNFHEGSVIPAQGKYKVTASYTPTAQGQFNCRIVMETNSTEAPKLEITGWGTVQDKKPAEITIEPKK